MDLIKAFQVVAIMDTEIIYLQSDVDGNNQIGLEELAYILQTVASDSEEGGN